MKGKERTVRKVDDKQIVNLFLQRDERAISETEKKYGKIVYNIANGVLNVHEDSEECVNDTYKAAWDTIPPNKPQMLGAYLGKIARNLAINRYNFNSAGKRNKSLEITLSELEDFLPSPDFAEDLTRAMDFKRALNRFLRALPEKKRNIFIQRYWYFSTVEDIAVCFDMSESSVKTCLLRLREKLKKYLEREGICV